MGEAIALIGFAATVIGFVTLLIRAFQNMTW